MSERSYHGATSRSCLSDEVIINWTSVLFKSQAFDVSKCGASAPVTARLPPGYHLKQAGSAY